MADQQSPTVEIAPTVIVSNSNEGEENAGSENSIDAPHSDGPTGDSGSSLDDDATPQSENVAIAAIEAERDITLAAIHSDVERERIELEGERIEAIAESNEELEICRREIAALTEKVEALATLLIPPLPLEVVEMTEELPTVEETDLIQPSTQVPTVETMTEPLEESVEERLEEIPSRVRRFIAI